MVLVVSKFDPETVMDAPGKTGLGETPEMLGALGAPTTKDDGVVTVPAGDVTVEIWAIEEFVRRMFSRS